MKNCKTCNQTKSLTEFYTHRKDCKSCVSTQYHANKTLKGYPKYQPKVLPTERTCRVCNNTMLISEFYVSKPAPGRLSPKIETMCKSCTRLQYQANRDVIRAKARAKAPPPKPRPPVMTAEQTRARVAAYKRRRRYEDPVFRLRSNIGTAIANALAARGLSKRKTTAQIVGCSFVQLRLHIEQQFLPGMSWLNRELWHIDHIVPQCLARTEEQVIMLNHHTNLRPLWSIDNQHKAGTITQEAKTHPLYTKLYTP